MLGLGSRLGLELELKLGSSFGQKFANFASVISKLSSAFCKLRRLTNRAQHYNQTEPSRKYLDVELTTGDVRIIEYL